MAKKPKVAATKPLTAATAAAASVPVINANVGDTLTVFVDVENVNEFYKVQYDTTTLMLALVDRQESVVLMAGTHRLAWSFTHMNKDWKHKISAQINQAPVVLLDERSEANKDGPYTLGLAFVDVA